MDIDRLRTRYRGSTADSYEERRADSEKWQREQDTVSEFLKRISAEMDDPLVLDVPVGTGRFMDLYQRLPVRAVGVDVSEDMLSEARSKLNGDAERISLQEGDIMNLSELDISPDVIVCIRFMNWLDLSTVKEAIDSIARTGPAHLIVGVRVQRSVLHRGTGLLRRSYHRLTNQEEAKTTIHDQARISTLFVKAGFRERERKLVDESILGDKYIYWFVAD